MRLLNEVEVTEVKANVKTRSNSGNVKAIIDIFENALLEKTEAHKACVITAEDLKTDCISVQTIYNAMIALKLAVKSDEVKTDYASHLLIIKRDKSKANSSNVLEFALKF